MTSSPVPSFSALFSQSVQVTKALWKPIILGMLLWTSLMGILVVLAAVAIAVAGPAQDMDAALADGVGAEEIRMMIIVLAFVTFAVFVGWGATTYSQVLAVERKPRVRDTLRRVPSVMLPLAYSSVWVFVRSLVWVPLIALLVALVVLPQNDMMTVLLLLAGMLAMLVCAAVFVPRLLLTPAILIGERLGALESVKKSEKYTKGHWRKVVGNWLLLVLILWIVSFGMQSVMGQAAEQFVGLIEGDGAAAGKIVAGILAFIAAVVYVLVYSFVNFVPFVFIAQLTHALKVHPKK